LRDWPQAIRLSVTSALRFGRFEWLPDSRELRSDGRAISIGRRAGDVLGFLIRYRERLVTKEELLDCVWAGLVVEENNLQVQISALRKLLGPQAIVTIPGRGYRFVAVVDGPAALKDAQTAELPRATPGSSAGGGPFKPRMDLTPIHGRTDDLRLIHELFEAHRLVTIVGTAGIGKTHLATAFAHSRLGRHDAEVWCVDLTTVKDASGVVGAIGAAMGIGSQRGDNVRSRVVQGLRARRGLIVIDNCETLVDPVADIVGEGLATAADVRWLITSQQRLKLAVEQVYRLGPLAVPPRQPTSAAHALEFGAVALLAERVSAADRRFEITDANAAAAIDLCAKLDGIPLAIEMAAARVPTLGLERVCALLDQRLRLLSAGHRTPLARHQTLHAALDWSHSLLDAKERIVLRKLAVFVGGFSLRLAQDLVTGTDLGSPAATIDDWDTVEALERLIDKSLVQTRAPSNAGELRYSLLETTRLYALERLAEAGEHEATHRRHARTMARFAEQAFAEHWTQTDAAVVALMGPEIDNLRAALHWAVAHSEAESAVSIAGNAWPLFRIIDRQYESQAWMNLAQPLIRQAGDACAARALAAIVYVFSGHRGGPRVVVAAREAVDRYREIDDEQGLYLALAGLAFAGASFGEPGSDAVRDAQVAVAELDRLERPQWPARLRCWGRAARTRHLHDDPARRLASLQTMYDLAESVGATERALTAQTNMLDALRDLGRIGDAIDLARAAVARGLLAGERLGFVLLGLSEDLVKTNRADEARQCARDALRVMSQCDASCEAFFALASIALGEGRCDDAARIAGYATSIISHEGIERAAQLRAGNEIVLAIDAKMPQDVRQRLVDEGARLSRPQASALALRIGAHVASQ
jgi:predicted ATPase/DNA-binding winged helix-turn-helix (wHTH) protein